MASRIVVQDFTKQTEHPSFVATVIVRGKEDACLRKGKPVELLSKPWPLPRTRKSTSVSKSTVLRVIKLMLASRSMQALKQPCID